MKSLEILEHIKNAPSFMGGDDRYKNNIQSHWVFLEDIETIKQDLEVLEILQVLILHNGKSVGYKGIIRDFEVMFRLEKITKEQLDKLKQWLEENERC